MPQRQRILVANSNRFLGNSIWSRLIPEPEFEIVGLACTPEEAVEMAATLAPDVVLADMTHPDPYGLDTIHILHTVYPKIPIIAFMPVSPVQSAQIVLEAGATACLTRSEIADLLIQTLRNLIPIRSLVTTHLLTYSEV